MRSLILHAPEIRSLLDSGECELRRTVKTDFNITDDGLWMRNGTAFLRRVNGHVFTDDQLMRAMAGLFCPLGSPGDVLWVRETARRDKNGLRSVAAYKADGYQLEYGEQWVPAACMPQWASRLTVEVASVFVERVEDKWWWVARVRKVER